MNKASRAPLSGSVIDFRTRREYWRPEPTWPILFELIALLALGAAALWLYFRIASGG